MLYFLLYSTSYITGITFESKFFFSNIIAKIFFLVQDRQDRFQGNYQQNRNQNWQDRRNQRQNYSQRERAY